MSELDADEGVESEGLFDGEPYPDGVREAVLFGAEGEIHAEYPVGVISFEGDPTVFIQVISITVVQGRVLVAVPFSAWRRSISRRAVPQGSLSRAASFAVQATHVGDRKSEAEGMLVKMWVGYLSPALETSVRYPPDGEEVLTLHHPFQTEDGDSEYLPLAQALVTLADDRFAFASAASQESSQEARLIKLEGGIASLQESIRELVAVQSQGRREQPIPPTRTQPKASPTVSAGLGSRKALPGLDSAVVAAARQAGVPESHLAEMSRLAAQRKGPLQDAPGRQGRAPEKVDVLGEPVAEEFYDEAAVAEPQPNSTDAISNALIKLTTIVDHLATKKTKKSTLEDLLDDSGPNITEASSSSSSSRRNAAVIKALRKALVESPEDIFAVLYQAMQEDFGSRVGGPGESGSQQPTFRGWAEHRSRIPNIQGSVRVAWSISGALDCLVANRIDEAKARLGYYWPS